MNTAREGTATASLGNPSQCLTMLILNTFFLTSDLDLPSAGLKPLPLVLSVWALERSVSPSLL